MQSVGLLARRFGAARGLLSAFFAVVLVVSALLAGVVSYLETATLGGIRETVQNAAPSDAALRVKIRLASDASAQNSTVESALESLYSGSGAQWSRTVESSPLTARVNGEGQSTFAAPTEQFVVAASEGVQEQSELLSGEWPTSQPGGEGEIDKPISAALHRGAAERLGIEVGDTITLGVRGDIPPAEQSSSEAPRGAPLRVVAIWQPLDPEEPFWFGDPLAFGGQSGSAFGPLLIAENGFAQLSAQGISIAPYARWTIAPDAAELTAQRVDVLRDAIARTERELRSDAALNSQGVSLSGGLDGILERVQRSLQSVSALAPVPLVLIATIALIALAQLSRLLATARAEESALLRARGASAQQLATTTLVESAVLAIPAATLGVVLGQVLGSALATATASSGWVAPSASAFTRSDFSSAIMIGVLATAAALLLAVVIALFAAARPSGQSRDDGSRRSAGAMMMGITVLVVAAAALALWQFFTVGSPLRVSSGRGSDAFAALAPALTLVAGALLCLLLIAPLSSAAALVAARLPGLSPALPARQLARRVSVFSVAALLVMLATAGTSFAAGFSSQWRELDTNTALLGTGSAVRVQGASVNVGPESAATLIDPPDSAVSAPVLTAPVVVGSTDAHLLALPAALVPDVVPNLGSRIDTTRLTTQIASPAGGVALPAETASVQLTFGAEAPSDAVSGSVHISLWLSTRDSAVLQYSVGVVPLSQTDDPLELTLSIPDAAGSSLLAVEARLVGAGTAEGVQLQLKEVAASQNAAARDADAAVLDFGTDNTLTLSWKTPNARIALGAPATAVPLAMTSSLARELGVSRGDEVELRLSDDRRVRGAVSAVAPLLPTAGGAAAILADLGAVQRFLLGSHDAVPAANELWLAPPPGTTIDAQASREIAQQVLAQNIAGISVSTPATLSTETLFRPAVAALWAGAVGAALLAIIAVMATALALLSARRGEIVVLRALGVSAAQQARGRAVELAAVLCSAAVLGLVAGVAATAITAGILARAAVGSAPSDLHTGLSFELLPMLLLLGVLALALFGVTAVSARRVRRLALDTSLREETR